MSNLAAVPCSLQHWTDWVGPEWLKSLSSKNLPLSLLLSSTSCHDILSFFESFLKLVIFHLEVDKNKFNIVQLFECISLLLAPSRIVKNRSSYLLFMIDWWWQQQMFVYNSLFLTVTIWRDFSMPFTFWLVQPCVFPRFSSSFVFLQFFSPFDVLSFARSVLGERTMLPDQSFQTSAKKCSKTP